jgi:hypothetical protein
MVGDRLFDIEDGQTELQLPSSTCLTLPICGLCRHMAERHRYDDDWDEPILDGFWSDDS